MTDLHTHILPCMDDGPRSVDMSLEMLKMEYAQGVTTVALTSHFHPARETADHFLSRREASFRALKEGILALPSDDRDRIPQLILAAEVVWVHSLTELRDLHKLCYENTRYLLVELPFGRWTDRLFDELDDFVNRSGMVPVIAHIDRYFAANPPKQMETLSEFSLPVQISADSVSRFFTSRRSLNMLRDQTAQLVISDCHDPSSRQPNLGEAYAKIEKKLGSDFASKVRDRSDSLIKTSVG